LVTCPTPIPPRSSPRSSLRPAGSTTRRYHATSPIKIPSCCSASWDNSWTVSSFVADGSISCR
jgi:hypothetical protein